MVKHFIHLKELPAFTGFRAGVTSVSLYTYVSDVNTFAVQWERSDMLFIYKVN